MNSKQENEKWNYYYDAMECLDMGDNEEAKLLLRKAIELDEDFVAGYVGMTVLCKFKGNDKKVKRYTNLAFKKTKKRFPKWPEEMLWGIIENRQYLRAICDKAVLHHRNQEKKKAKKLYSLLLELNPRDNQGIRYLLAALHADKPPSTVDKLIDEGNRLQDWSKLEELLKTQNEKYKFWNKPNSC